MTFFKIQFIVLRSKHGVLIIHDYLKQVYRLPFYLDLKWNDDCTLYMYILLAAFCDVFFFEGGTERTEISQRTPSHHV